MLPKESKQRVGSHFCQGIVERLEQEMTIRRTSLVVQWLRLHTPNAGGTGSILGQGTKIPYAVGAAIKKKKKRKNLTSKMRKYRNKENQSNKTK